VYEVVIKTSSLRGAEYDGRAWITIHGWWVRLHASMHRVWSQTLIRSHPLILDLITHQSFDAARSPI
jgi:hypothetical protein